MFFHLFKRENSEDKKFRKQLQEILGFNPSNLSYYKLAVQHGSLKKSKKGKRDNNERMEFLGDSVIGLIASLLVYRKYPHAPEGVLTILRSTLVSRKSLNHIAEDMGIKRIVRYRDMSISETKDISGNSLEALVAAVYFDKGYKKCEKFVIDLFAKYFDLDNIIKQHTDYKSALVQCSQKEKFELLVDTFESMEDRDKQYHFVSEICINGKFVAVGKGWTKKDAEQLAAKSALQKLGKEL